MTSDFEDPTSSDPLGPPRKGRIPTYNPAPIIPYVPPAAVLRQLAASRSNYNRVATPPAERQAQVAGKGELLPLIYGTDQIGAKVTDAVALGTDLYLRLEWCEGSVDAISSVLVDEAAPAGGVTFTHYTGSQVTPDPSLVTAFAAQGITYSDTLTGVAYSVGKFPAGSTQGFPRCVAQVRGVKVKTTSGGTPAYNDNPVWLIAYLLTERLGASIDWASFATAAADACDVLVGGEKKRAIGATLDTEQGVTQWLSVALGYAGCFLWFDDGVYGLTADTASTPVSATITEALMRDGELQLQSRNTKKSPTVVRIYYTNTSVSPWVEDYAEASLPGAGSTLPYLLSEVRMPWINRHSQANREAVEKLNEFTLNDLSATFMTRDQGLAHLPGDLIEITHSLGLSSKKMRVLACNPIEPGRYRIDTQEFDPAKYSSVVVSGPTYDDTSLPSPSSAPTVTGLALVEQIEPPGPGGQPRSKIKATWTKPVWPFLDGYVVHVYDDSGNLLQEAAPIANSWRSDAFPAPQRLTVYVKARSALATAAGYDSEQITLNGSSTSLTLLGSFPILRAGATIVGFTPYTLYPGDPMLRVTLTTGISVASQYATATIADAVSPDSFLNYGIGTATYISKNDYYVTTDPVDMGSIRDMTVRVNTLSAVPGLISIQAAPTASGPWTTQETSIAHITGRWVRVRVTVSDMPRSLTLPDGTAVSLATPGPWLFQQDLGGATLQVYGATVEETGQVTTSASGPVTVTLANTYYAQRDLQVTAIDSNGTAIVTANNVGPSPTAINTFEINATVSGARVAVPVRWNFKGAV